MIKKLITSILVFTLAFGSMTSVSANSDYCPDYEYSDGLFSVCKGSEIDHFGSGIDVHVLSYRNNYVILQLEGAREDRIRLRYQRPRVVQSDNGADVTFIFRKKDGDRAMIEIQSDRGLACANETGNDDLWLLCSGYEFAHQPSGTTFRIGRITSRYVVLYINGARTASKRVYFNRSRTIVGLDNTKIVVTYNRYVPGIGAYAYFESTPDLQMTCGDQEGGDGRYSACLMDRIEHSSGVNAIISGHTGRELVVRLTGRNRRKVRLIKDRPRMIYSNRHRDLRVTYLGTNADGSALIEILSR